MRTKSEIPQLKTLATVMGIAQIDVFQAMCYLHGRRPNQLASDILLDSIQEALARDPDVIKLARALRRNRSGLRAVQ